MKKIMLVLAALCLVTSAFAVNLNLSVDNIRMFARYATVNSVEAANYNPAGLPKIANGLYVNASNQFIYKKYSFTMPNLGFAPYLGQTYTNDAATQFTYLFPSANIVFKQDNWAVFFNFNVSDGGGKLEYAIPSVIVSGGLIPIGTSVVTAESQWFDFALGGSYAINDMFAVSLGVDMLMPSQSVKISHSLAAAVAYNSDTKYNGLGFSGQVGVNITPVKPLNIGITYKSQAIWATNDKNSAGNPTFYAPNIIQVGVGYEAVENLTVQVGYKIALDSLTPNMVNKYNNNMEFSLGAEYQVIPQVRPSFGVAYQINRGTEATNGMLNVNPDLNAFKIGVGAVITPVKNLDITVGYMYPIVLKSDYDSKTKTNYEKNMQVFGIGVSYKFF